MNWPSAAGVASCPLLTIIHRHSNIGVTNQAGVYPPPLAMAQFSLQGTGSTSLPTNRSWDGIDVKLRCVHFCSNVSRRRRASPIPERAAMLTASPDDVFRQSDVVTFRIVIVFKTSSASWERHWALTEPLGATKCFKCLLTTSTGFTYMKAVHWVE